MRSTILICLCFVALFLVGCFRHVHTFGSGPHTTEVVQEHQWYVLWGVIPVGDDVDGGKIAGYNNYRVTTEFKAMDCVINFFTGIVSVYRTTVTVEK